MAKTKKEETPEEETKFVTKFFKEEGVVDNKEKKARKHWSECPIPASIKISPIVDKLRTVEQVVEEFVAEIPWKLSMEESDNIEKIRKDNVFGEEVTESERDIIQQRVALQQRQFAEFEKREKSRKFKKVYAIYDYLTIEEMEEMLVDCSNDEDEIIVRLTQPGYLLGIRKTIATRHTPEVESSRGKMSSEQLEAYQQLLKKRSGTLKKTTNDSAKKQYRMGGRLTLDDALKQVQENGVNADKAFEGWSSARIRAYQMIEQNPNSYYYRFNAPGEIQRKGQWSPKEREIFFKRLDELGANGQWGIFAMEIPGRVGYQCSNFYRLLVQTGEINDPNYVLDDKGKAHYLFDKKSADGTVEKTFRTHSKHGTGRASASTTSSTGTTTTRRRAPATTTATTTTTTEKKTVKRRKRKTRGWNSDDDEDEDDFEDYNDTSGTYTSSTRTRASSRRTRTRSSRLNSDENDNDDDGDDQDYTTSAAIPEMDYNQNPLPGFIDPITLDEVEKPAISKYGHVMGYDSWVRCLTNWEGKKNICPLTKNPLTKRDLVILTFENIDEYRDKILNQ